MVGGRFCIAPAVLVFVPKVVVVGGPRRQSLVPRLNLFRVVRGLEHDGGAQRGRAARAPFRPLWEAVKNGFLALDDPSAQFGRLPMPAATIVMAFTVTGLRRI
jgi:hypothetical protein